ncbi:DDE-type integrase/transposase/recombinase [Alicyclobacillus suci]|uniref:DDE-type integrase/transposase/recombinase n=1 Tax=Alicyclobacillus suci TaxID=2816080 RepID=UPI001A8C4F86|nr:DDE-type integrase/transposase/recombinase [Alicyclobacillus suci]
MDRKKLVKEIAAFRYGTIAPIVSRQTPLSPGELRAYFERMVQQSYVIPGTTRTTLSVRTLERWLETYRKGGYDALMPKTRNDKGRHRLPEEVIQKAVALRRERPERSVEQIILLLEASGIVEPGTVAQSTLARHLRRLGASRKELLRSDDRGHRRFEAEDVHALWQADFKHALYLPDPSNPERKKKAILFAILDDYSRLIVHGQFYWDEQLPRLEDSLKKAILRYGIPEQLYVDNGAVFSSQHLQRICGKLGIHLSHSKAYRPAGRGKIERIFRFLDTSFIPEAYEQVEAGHIRTLGELNEAFWAWVDGYYHLRKHGSTGAPPKERAASSNRVPKRVSEAELTEIFLWEEERTADKAACVSLMGNTYEVDADLARQKVTLRYDPFDLSVIQVWSDDKRWSNANPVDLTRRYDRRVSSTVKSDKATTEHVSFFQAVDNRRKQAAVKESPLRFSETKRGERK